MANWREEDLGEPPSRPHGKDNVVLANDEAAPQPPKKCKAAGPSDDSAKRLRAETRATVSAEAEKRKNLIHIPDDDEDNTKVPTVP